MQESPDLTDDVLDLCFPYALMREAYQIIYKVLQSQTFFCLTVNCSLLLLINKKHMCYRAPYVFWEMSKILDFTNLLYDGEIWLCINLLSSLFNHKGVSVRFSFNFMILNSATYILIVLTVQMTELQGYKTVLQNIDTLVQKLI